MATAVPTRFLDELTADQRRDLAAKVEAVYRASVSCDYSAMRWRKTVPGRYALLLDGVQIGWVTRTGSRWEATAATETATGVPVASGLRSRSQAGAEICGYQHTRIR